MAKKITLTNRRTGEVIESDDEHIIVPDGFEITVPLFMMDALQREVADAARVGHRSGYQIASGIVNDGQRTALVDERAAAYEERNRWLADAYRQATGFFTGTGKLDEQERADTAKLFRSAPAAAGATDAATSKAIRDAAYNDYVSRLTNAWKGPANAA